jgi:osmotically-inducible protein OsmY
MSRSVPRAQDLVQRRPSSVAPGTEAESSRRLRHSGYSALWDVSCEADGATVHLRGRLRSHYLKQMAQAIVAEVEGVRRVVNLIEVAAPARGPGAGTASNRQIEVSTDFGNKPQS